MKIKVRQYVYDDNSFCYTVYGAFGSWFYHPANGPNFFDHLINLAQASYRLTQAQQAS